MKLDQPCEYENILITCIIWKTPANVTERMDSLVLDSRACSHQGPIPPLHAVADLMAWSWVSILWTVFWRIEAVQNHPIFATLNFVHCLWPTPLPQVQENPITTNCIRSQSENAIGQCIIYLARREIGERRKSCILANLSKQIKHITGNLHKLMKGKKDKTKGRYKCNVHNLFIHDKKESKPTRKRERKKGKY